MGGLTIEIHKTAKKELKTVAKNDKAVMADFNDAMEELSDGTDLPHKRDVKCLGNNVFQLRFGTNTLPCRAMYESLSNGRMRIIHIIACYKRKDNNAYEPLNDGKAAKRRWFQK